MSAESLRIEIEGDGPLPTDIKVYVVDPATGYKSLLEGVQGITFFANMGAINTVNLEVVARRVNVQGVLDKVEEAPETA